MRNTILMLAGSIFRNDANGEGFLYDVTISYKVISYSPGTKGRYYGEPGDCYPSEAPRYEFEFVSAEIENPGDDPAPLTSDETEQLIIWFEANHEAACNEADDKAEDTEEDPDDWRERMYEDRMERRHG